MKKLILSLAVAILTVACSATEQERSRENFKAVEQSTGKVIGNAGEIVGAGVDALDKSWETPEEQRRKAKQEADAAVEPAPLPSETDGQQDEF